MVSLIDWWKSKGIYKSLNCGPGSSDKKKCNKNLKIVIKKLINQKIFLLNQIHSNKFYYIDKKYKFKKKIKGDA